MRDNQSHGPARARALRTRWAALDDATRDQLAATIGATLRSHRTARGLSYRATATRAGCSPPTVVRVERGTIRPRPSLLGALAYALDPDNPAPIAESLRSAAGDLLAPDTPASARRRARRVLAGLDAGTVPLPPSIVQRLTLHQRADAMRHRAHRLLNARSTLAQLAEADRLLTEADRLRETAGPPLTVRLGRRVVRAGWGL